MSGHQHDNHGDLTMGQWDVQRHIFEIARLRAENENMGLEISDLRAQLATLHIEHLRVVTDVDRLRDENERLTAMMHQISAALPRSGSIEWKDPCVRISAILAAAAEVWT